MSTKRIAGIILIVLAISLFLLGSIDIVSWQTIWIPFFVSFLLGVYFLVAPGPQRRTVLIEADLEAVYKKCFQWFGLQGYEITEQVKNNKIAARMGRSNLILTFEKTEEGTFIIVECSNRSSLYQYNQLIGILSLLSKD